MNLDLSGQPRELARRTTAHNALRVLEEPSGVRVLLLDPSGRQQSVWCPWDPYTYGVWDAFALAPPVVPEGPVGILGLGAGSVPRLYRALWPERRLVAWELDREVVEVAREHFALDDLGPLEVRVGDALAAGDGGYAALLVDLFLGGEAPPALEDAGVWARLARRLLPGGRLLANLGGDGPRARRVLALLAGACGGALARILDGGNLFAISGPPPPPGAWRALPAPLRGLAAEGWGETKGQVPLQGLDPAR